MTFADGFRLWFLALYLIGILSFIGLVIRFRVHRERLEKQVGPLPSPGILVPFGLPLLLLLTRFGEMAYVMLPLRWIGVVISVYGLVMQFWTLRTLGRFALPGAGIYKDHKLITSGPFRHVRHPLYSAAVAFWLGTGLGAMNWLLLVTWPLIVIMVISVPVRQEEKLLGEKFGHAYQEYSQQTGQIIPRP